TRWRSAGAGKPGLKSASPLYSATTEWAPTGSAGVVKVATPLPRATVAAADPSMTKVTEPVGVLFGPVEAAATVTVKVTASPTTDGLSELASPTVTGGAWNSTA